VSTSNAARSTRDAILDAAVRLLADRGAGVTLEQVVEEAGVSRQTVYVHFGSRTGLLIAMVQHMDESGVLHGLVQRVFDARTALDALDAVVNVHADYHPMAYPVARVFMASRHEDEAIGAAWDERMASCRIRSTAVLGVHPRRVAVVIDSKYPRAVFIRYFPCRPEHEIGGGVAQW
jgi:AcrR family transcriptional regulator